MNWIFQIPDRLAGTFPNKFHQLADLLLTQHGGALAAAIFSELDDLLPLAAIGSGWAVARGAWGVQRMQAGARSRP